MEVQGQSEQIVHKTPSPKQSEQNELEVLLKQLSACFANAKA
jgi:hypothetical protein